MDKEELLKRAKDPKYISGIYNYCDRWCERCQFTSRCLNCTLVEEQFGDLQENDELNEAFWLVGYPRRTYFGVKYDNVI